MAEEKEEKMNEENEEEIKEESNDNSEDNREEETRDEIRDNVYVNDDEIKMLRNMEKRFDALETKIDNMISMYVDSGAIIQDSAESVSEQERKNYDDDFINIDKLDLAL